MKENVDVQIYCLKQYLKGFDFSPLLFFFFIYFAVVPVFSQGQQQWSFRTEEYDVVVETVAEGFEHPWSVVFVPENVFNGGYLVSERPGRLVFIQRGSGTKTAVLGLPNIFINGQGGLLDVVLAPDFAKSKQIFFSYSVESAGRYGTAVGSAVLTKRSIETGPFELTGVKEIFRMNRFSSRNIHFGSRLAFLSDGSLLVTLGERGEQDRAQDTSDHAGSVIRLVPSVGTTGSVWRAEVYSWGHRNPQGLVVAPAADEGRRSGISGSTRTGETIWITEHGPKGGDELNLIKPGKNYGWPVVTFGLNYNGTVISDKTEAPGIEAPVYQWTPSIAPSGLAYYDGDTFAEWRKNLFAGALKFQQIQRLVLEEGKVVHREVLFEKQFGRIRDVRTGPDGYLYFLTDEKAGKLYRVRPSE